MTAAQIVNLRGLLAKLRRQVEVGRTMGTGWLGYKADGTVDSGMSGNLPIMAPANLDGPAAADAFELLLDAAKRVERLEGAREAARQYCRSYLLDERVEVGCCSDEQHMAAVITLFDALNLDEDGRALLAETADGGAG